MVIFSGEFADLELRISSKKRFLSKPDPDPITVLLKRNLTAVHGYTAPRIRNKPENELHSALDRIHTICKYSEQLSGKNRTVSDKDVLLAMSGLPLSLAGELYTELYAVWEKAENQEVHDEARKICECVYLARQMQIETIKNSPK